MNTLLNPKFPNETKHIPSGYLEDCNIAILEREDTAKEFIRHVKEVVYPFVSSTGEGHPPLLQSFNQSGAGKTTFANLFALISDVFEKQKQD